MRGLGRLWQYYIFTKCYSYQEASKEMTGSGPIEKPRGGRTPGLLAHAYRALPGSWNTSRVSEGDDSNNVGNNDW